MAKFTIEEIFKADDAVHGVPVCHELTIHHSGGHVSVSGKIRKVGVSYWIGSACFAANEVLDDLDGDDDCCWHYFTERGSF